MATYQAKHRDPLLDTDLQAVIEKRSRELVGIGMIILGLMVTLMLASYVPDDPSWLSVSSEPAQNWLGRPGASIASPLYVIVGWGSWAIALVLVTWGVRFVVNAGSERALGRLIFAPIAIAALSVYASTHVPSLDWTHSFGLGGLFGDMVLGMLLEVIPFSTAFGLKSMSLLMGAGMIAMLLFVLGVTKPELRRFGRFLFVGLIVSYSVALTWAGKGARGAALANRAMQAKRAARHEHQPPETEPDAFDTAPEFEPLAEPRNRVLRAEPAMMPADPAPVAAPMPMAQAPAETGKQGLLARLPSLRKRQPEPEPELIEPGLAPDVYESLGSEDRIRAKISDVVKSRVRQEPALQAPRPEPGSTRARGPKPLVLEAAVMTDPGSPQPAAQMAIPAVPRAPVVPMPPGSNPALTAAQPVVTAPVPKAVPKAVPPKAVVQHPPRQAPAPSRQAKAEAQPALEFEQKPNIYETPPLSLLANHIGIQRQMLSDEALEENARMLETVLDDYGIKGDIVSVRPGPVVTMYELEPAPGLKASRVIGLADDIARSMSALSARVSTVPGRSVIGIELPNENREKVMLREILSARDFGDSNMKLPLALGKGIGGEAIVANLAKMPHLLIAGTTGSGKSVAINTMILSLLYKLTPEECRLIMIDPKMLELSVYDGIPHLLSPVVTDPKKAVVALKWVVGEMEERYRKMSKMGVRNIDGYNSRVKDALDKGEMFNRTVQTGFDDATGDPVFETDEFAPETLPYIVVVVDEMADLMMVAGKEIEACIQRLAQMARASGIHLIMATQRPSVDVITGTIKANFPTRISFQVTSKIDSRTILGEQGAEQLLGMGDMLYMAGGAKITRVHGPFVSDEEVEEIVNHLKSFGEPSYINGVIEGPDPDSENNIDAVLGLGGNTDGNDALYDEAVAIVIKDRKCSTSYIQRKLAIGYNKAARLVEQMEDSGLVSSANHVGKRNILVPEQN
jgi:S-DNA-T family DNA segregation ATPase FtsK/SpoIIIE